MKQVLVLLKAIATFCISFMMGMLGFFLGAFIFSGVSEFLLELETRAAFLAQMIGFWVIYGAALVGGIFGLQKGARWTRLLESFRDD